MTKPEPQKAPKPKVKPKRKSRIWACSGFKNSVIYPEKVKQ